MKNKPMKNKPHIKMFEKWEVDFDKFQDDEVRSFPQSLTNDVISLARSRDYEDACKIIDEYPERFLQPNVLVFIENYKNIIKHLDKRSPAFVRGWSDPSIILGKIDNEVAGQYEVPKQNEWFNTFIIDSLDEKNYHALLNYWLVTRVCN